MERFDALLEMIELAHTELRRRFRERANSSDDLGIPARQDHNVVDRLARPECLAEADHAQRDQLAGQAPRFERARRQGHQLQVVSNCAQNTAARLSKF